MNDIDRQAREAARRLRDEVVDTVDVDLAVERAQQHSAARRLPLAAAAVVVVALVAAAFWFSPPEGDVEVAVDEDEPVTTTTTTAPEVQAPNPIVLGAPDDGKDSVGLPVAAEPSTGLVDGQSVAVSGSGFPANESIGVVMCAKEAGAEHGGRGVDACNIGHFGQGTSDAQGNVTIEFAVRRLVVLDGQEIDCASEPGRCILGMGMISDYDQSGGVQVDFDPEVPLPEPPAVELSQTTGIADGEVVPARVTGLYPDSSLYVEQCAADGEMRCTMVGQVETDDEGTFDGGLRLWRNFGTWFDPAFQQSPNVDCAVERCVLRLGGETPAGRQIPEVEISFDANRGSRTAPALALLSEGPFAEGDTIEVTLDGVDEQSYVDLLLCPDHDIQGYGGCFPFASTQHAGGTISARIDFAFLGIDNPCAEGCLLSANWYSTQVDDDGYPQGPPPLQPEPIAISITG